MYKVLVFFGVVAYALAAPRNCATEFGINDAAWEEVKNDSTNPPEKVLCYLRCVYENVNGFKSDKTLDSGKVLEEASTWAKFDDTVKTYLKNCIEKSGPVNACADMRPPYLCLLNAEIKQGIYKPNK